ncbi:MAG: hypothetical protein D6720_09415 [Gammaproteobacteria bacterium]|nr:MAG: hypothetical protein D6720_09415 [Gammaproteobacteria bacterium]
MGLLTGHCPGVGVVSEHTGELALALSNDSDPLMKMQNLYQWQGLSRMFFHTKEALIKAIPGFIRARCAANAVCD